MSQLNVVTVGPLATADADGVSLSQTAAAAQYLVVNGALAAGTFDADSICASQTPTGAGALTINGALATTNPVAGAGGTAAAGSATVRFATPTRIYITAAGDESGRTFTVVGTVQSPTSFGPGAVVSETITGPNANTVASDNLYSTIISVSVDAATAGALTVGHSGTATMDKARRVSIASGGDDTSITFTLTGTDWNNDPISEVVTGVSGAAASSVLSYKTVTSVKTSAAAASTLIVGTNTTADSPPVYFDRLAANAQVAIQVDGVSTPTWTVQQTLNDPTVITNQLPTPTYQWSPSSIKWVNHPDTALVGSTVISGVQGTYAAAPVMSRVSMTTSSTTAAVTAQFVQAYMS